jgi:hypothetical protein
MNDEKLEKAVCGVNAEERKTPVPVRANRGK